MAAVIPDMIDEALGAQPGDARHALRRRRAKVVDASEAALEAVLDRDLPGLSLAERLEAAQVVAQSSGCEPLAACYRARLAAVTSDAAGDHAHAAGGAPACVEDARRATLLGFARTLAERPQDAGRERLLALPAAGLSVDAVVTLAQLIGLVAYQARVVAEFLPTPIGKAFLWIGLVCVMPRFEAAG